MSKSAQVHRFGDSCALYVGSGQTLYITPKEARKLSGAINKVCRSCERESFLNSTGTTTSLEFAPHQMDRTS